MRPFPKNDCHLSDKKWRLPNNLPCCQARSWGWALPHNMARHLFFFGSVNHSSFSLSFWARCQYMVAEIPCYLAEKKTALAAASCHQATDTCQDMRQKSNRLLSLDHILHLIKVCQTDELWWHATLWWQKRFPKIVSMPFSGQSWALIMAETRQVTGQRTMTVLILLNRLKTLARNGLLSAYDPHWSEL